MKRRAWLLYLALGSAVSGLYFFVHPFAGLGPVFNLLGLSSAAVILVGVKLHRPERPLPWYLFAAGQVLFVIGDLIYYSWPKIFHTEVPFPNIGDAFYLAVYPTLVAGVLFMIRRRNPARNRSSLIDALIITTGIGLLSWIFLMAPYAHDPSLSLMSKLISIAYPLGDLLLLSVAVRLAVDTGTRRPTFYLLVLSIVGLLGADAVYGYITLNGSYTTGGALDIGWIAYYLLWGAAALHPSMRSLSEPTGNRGSKLTWNRLALLAGASLMAPAVQLILAAKGQATDTPVIATGSVILFLLVVARMAGLVRTHEEAEGRERALREAGAALVVATSREDIYGAALETIVALVGEDRPIRLCLALEGSKRFTVVAAAGEGAYLVRGTTVRLTDVPEETQSLLRRQQCVEVAGSKPKLRAALALPDQESPMFLAPLFVREELRGFLAVGGEMAQPLKDGLDALASQVALAVESATLTEDLHRRQSEARFRSLVQNSSDIVTVIDADTTIRYQTPSVERVLGYGPEELVGTRLLELIHPDDAPRVLSLLAGPRLEGGAYPDLIEFRLRHRDRTWLYTETIRTDLSEDPNVGGLVLNTRDITERKAFEEQLSHQAFHDPVTDLANRALFRNRVEHALERQRRDDRPVAVLFIDLDDFKTVNDSLGHAMGDQLLALVGERLKSTLRSADTAARLGGDEFGILLEDAGHTEAAEAALRVIDSLQDPFRLDGNELYVRASLGIAIGDQDRLGSKGAEELLRNADVAMYMAKAQGKGRYQVFEPQMHASVLQRLELKAELQRATEREEFQLHFQPIMVLATEKIYGVEALVRWQNPKRGLIPPNDFIPLAEETGLIVPIGTWVLRESCRVGAELQRRYQAEPPLSISVNLSARQLLHPELVKEVADALSNSGLDPFSLVLEITESVMMQDMEQSILRLGELKELGVRLAVDDFGTGYSSLNYIRQFPVDILKVDKSFIDSIHAGGEEAALTAAIIKLAGVLDLSPVAEGIERADQLDRLLELQCDMGQGFYFARPLDRSNLESLLDQAFTTTAGQSLVAP